MKMDVYKKQEQLLRFRKRILNAEKERLNGDVGISVAEAKNRIVYMAMQQHSTRIVFGSRFA